MPQQINPPGYWTKVRVCAVAARFETRTAFQKGHNTAYVIAYRRGWLDDVCRHMRPAGNKIRRFVYRLWSDERREVYIGIACNVQRRYSQHKSAPKGAMMAFISAPHRIETVTPSPISAADAAKLETTLVERYARQGWTVLNVAKAGGLGGGEPKWTKARLRVAIAELGTRLAFREGMPGAYVMAHRHGWIEELFADMPNRGLTTRARPHGHWTRDTLKAIADEYPTRGAMQNAETGAYVAAHKLGILDDIFAEHPNQGYTKAWLKRKARARSL